MFVLRIENPAQLSFFRSVQATCNLLIQSNRRTGIAEGLGTDESKSYERVRQYCLTIIPIQICYVTKVFRKFQKALKEGRRFVKGVACQTRLPRLVQLVSSPKGPIGLSNHCVPGKRFVDELGQRKESRVLSGRRSALGVACPRADKSINRRSADQHPCGSKLQYIQSLCHCRVQSSILAETMLDRRRRSWFVKCGQVMRLLNSNVESLGFQVVNQNMEIQRDGLFLFQPKMTYMRIDVR